jgi:hypothetical protein
MLRIPLGRRPQYMPRPLLRATCGAQHAKPKPRPCAKVPRQPSRASEARWVGAGWQPTGTRRKAPRSTEYPALYPQCRRYRVPALYPQCRRYPVPALATVPTGTTVRIVVRAAPGQRESHLDRQYHRRRRHRRRQIGFGSCPRYTRSGRTRAHNSAGTGLRIGRAVTAVPSGYLGHAVTAVTAWRVRLEQRVDHVYRSSRIFGDGLQLCQRARPVGRGVGTVCVVAGRAVLRDVA